MRLANFPGWMRRTVHIRAGIATLLVRARRDVRNDARLPHAVAVLVRIGAVHRSDGRGIAGFLHFPKFIYWLAIARA
jgi:hypothetical protein